MILISGEAGIGKTRLMQEFAKKNAHTVLVGNSHPSTQALPYYPLVQALRQALHRAQLWEGIPLLWLGELTSLLPELNNHFSGLPQPLEFEPEQAQTRLFEALTQVIMGLAVQDPPLMLCLDDLQWADVATLGWLSAISRRLSHSRVCIIGTCLQEEHDSVRGVQQAYRRADLLTEVKLAGLSRKAISDILRQVPGIGSTQTPLAAQLSHTTGGNTFFVLETVRVLIENEQLNTPPEQLPLPETVQETIQTRLARLDPLARQILDAAAVLSPNLEPVMLSATAGRTELEVADGLDELVRCQLLIEEEEELAFRHDLLRTTVYEVLTPWRRRLLHKRAAETLAVSYRLEQGKVALQIAQHYDAAGEVEKASQYYYQAALASRSIYAHEELIEYLQRALKLSSTSTLKWREIVKYYELLGDSLMITGKFESACQAYNDCLVRIPHEAYLQRVKCQIKIANALDSLYLLDQAEEIYSEALEVLNAHLDDQEELAWQQAWLDIHLARLGFFYQLARPEKMRALLEEIQPVIEKAGTPEQRSRFYEQQGGYRLRQDRYAVSEQTILSVEANLRANLEIGNPVRIAAAKFRLGFVLLWSGNLDTAEISLTEAFEMAEETGRLPLQLLCLVYLSCLRRLQGDVEGARTYATRSLEIAQQLNSVAYVGASYGNLAWLDWKDHNFDQAERQASEALSVWNDYPYPFKWLANWVLMAIYLDRDQLGKTIDTANLLLDPKQHRLQVDITMALESGIKNWEVQNIEKTRESLEIAVNLAKKWGYL